MRFLNKLERRLGRFAIPNLTVLLVACQGATWLVGLMSNQDAFSGLLLFPNKVLEGEVWRLVTFVGVSPATGILGFFYLYLFYMFGTTLENQWGIFRYNLYLLVGYLANVAVALLAGFFDNHETVMENYFLYGTILMAFAHLYPDFELRLFFVLPVKIKWFALVLWIVYGFSFLTGLGTFNTGGWVMSLTALASVSNYLLFFGDETVQRIYHRQRRANWHAKTSRNPRQPRHQCTICGITDITDPEMDFRYCTTCDGSPAYCSEHIRNHAHLKPGESPERATTKPAERGSDPDRDPNKAQPRLFE